jgi:hypothetical protein
VLSNPVIILEKAPNFDYGNVNSRQGIANAYHTNTIINMGPYFFLDLLTDKFILINLINPTTYNKEL